MTEPLQFSLTLYPEPVLRKVAAEVPAIDDDVRATVRAMFDLMYESNGVGLAAPQVGIAKRILVVNPSGKPEDELALVLRILEHGASYQRQRRVAAGAGGGLRPVVDALLEEMRVGLPS